MTELTTEQAAQITAAAYAVLLPITDSFDIDGWVGSFLKAGGRSVFLASSAEEYAARRISDRRRKEETAEQIRDFARALERAAGAAVILGVDAEPTGVARLEHVLPQLPDREAAAQTSDSELYETYARYAREARDLGVSLFAGPVLDIITGRNEWLEGRTLADDLAVIGHIGAVFTQAVQSQGVTAMAKHFPGHPDLVAHPVPTDITMTVDAETVRATMAPFAEVIAAGVGTVMVGPVTVEAIDPNHPAANSPAVIAALRSLGFSGLIVSDDLDAASTMRGRPLGQVAAESVAAGVQMLLFNGGAKEVAECATAIERAVTEDRLEASVLLEAAAAVATLADSTTTR